MKKNILYLLIFFLPLFACYSQKCFSDEYLEIFKQKDKQLENKIKEAVIGFGKKTNMSRGLTGNEIIMIPVVFNVIHDGEPEGTGRNLSLDKINEQITIMNEAFGGEYGGVDTKIRFCLAKKDFAGLPTTGVNRFWGPPQFDVGVTIAGECEFNTITDSQIKSNFQVGFASSVYLNIWTTDLKDCGDDSLLGYSSFPFYFEELEEANNILDGVVVDYMFIGNNSSSGSNGMTCVHEVGHWLGLFHIFDSKCTETNCEIEGDMLCDTSKVPSYGLTNIAAGNCLGLDCTGQSTSIVQNFMDYQDTNRFHCLKSFTEGQKQRMRDNLFLYRGMIYNQGLIYNLFSCSEGNTGGSYGSGCGFYQSLYGQQISPPESGDVSSFHRKFGSRVEINDKWVVTIDLNAYIYVEGNMGTPAGYTKYIRIYKRVGCSYVLSQSLNLPLAYYCLYGDYGLQLIDDEIVISSYTWDSVFIYKYDESTELWGLKQQIQNTSPNEVGTSTYSLGNFLFILEREIANNMFRVYYKDASGNYVFHQTLTVSGYILPDSGNYLQSANFLKQVVNFNSSSFTGSYDPLEILIASKNEDRLLILKLNSSNMWTLSATLQPPSLQNNEMISDIEVSRHYIHILTGDVDFTNFYSYKITPNSLNQLTSAFSKQEIEIYERGDRDHKMEIFNDQFVLVDNVNWGLKLFYNLNFFSTDYPAWQSANGLITCANRGEDDDDFEVFGNLLLYGTDDYSSLQLLDMKDAITMIGIDPAFIPSTDFYDKKICTIPNSFTTFAEKITIGETCPLEFNQIKKEFIGNKSITLVPGVTLAKGSVVELHARDIYEACGSILPRPANTNDENSDDYHLEEVADKDEFIIEQNSRLDVYPNPTKGFVTISARDLKISKVMVTSMEGKIIHTRNNINNYSYDLTMEDFQVGIYSVIVETVEGEIIVDKIIKN